MKTRTIPANVLLLLFVLCSAAFADIYQYVDEHGVLHFTNVGKGKNVRKVAEEPARIAVYQPAGAESGRSGSARAASSTAFLSAYSDIINEACYKHGVDPGLVHAIVKVESDFNTYALSRKGAMGLMQLMPQTALDLNVKNSFSPSENIYGGVKYLRYLLDLYEGNLQLALAAYNAGETSVKKWGTVPPFRETRQYVKKVLGIYNGNAGAPAVRYTIYIGYGNDGTLVLTDNPSNHPTKKFTRGPQKNL